MLDGVDFSWVLPVAKQAYENREAILSNWEKISTLLLGKKITIAVTGLPGVGKSVLCDYLTGKAYTQGYTTPGKSEDIELKNLAAKNLRIGLSIIPGQDSPNKLKALDDLFNSDSPVDGLIHVVANGFSTIRSPFSQEAIAGRSTDLSTYRQLRLEEEIEDISDVCEHIRISMRSSGKPTWMLIAVTKIDLYYNSIEEARDRYYISDSIFTKRIQKLSNQVGSDRFKWEVLPVCSKLDDFKLGKDIYSSQFREDERNHFVAQFTRKLKAICEAS